MREVMVDIEALGKVPSGCIVSVGVVAFDDQGIQASKYWLLDWNKQVTEGRDLDPDTVRWWFTQDKVAQEAITAVAGVTQSEDFVREFYEFFTENNTKAVWANGTSYDIAMLDHFFEANHIDGVTFDKVGLNAGKNWHECHLRPWTYREVYCMRALRRQFKSVLPYKPFKTALMAAGATAHNALDDATMQAKYVLETRKWINDHR